MRNSSFAILLGLGGLLVGLSPATAQVPFTDHFDDGALDAGWEVTFFSASGWTQSEVGSELVVSAISADVLNTESGGTWGLVRLTRDFPALEDYEVEMDFRWSASDVSAMHFVQLQAIGADGKRIGLGGFRDPWVSSQGSRIVVAGETSFNEPNDEGLEGSRTLRIAEDNGEAVVSIDGTEMARVTTDAKLIQVILDFGYFAFDDGVRQSTFGTLAVDRVFVDGTPREVLVLSKVARNSAGQSAEAFAPGDSVDYILGIVNRGSVDSGPTTFSDALPPELDYVGAEATSGTLNWDAANRNLTWVFDSLPVGVAYSATLQTTLKADAADRALVMNRARLTSVTAPHSSDGDALSTFQISVGGANGTQSADLEVLDLSSANRDNQSEGTFTTEYTLSLRNNGPSEAAGTVLSYALSGPAQNPRLLPPWDTVFDCEFMVNSAPPNNFTCTAPAEHLLAVGNHDIVLVVDRSGNLGAATVSLSSRTEDANPSNNERTINNLQPMGTQDISGAVDVDDCECRGVSGVSRSPPSRWFWMGVLAAALGVWPWRRRNLRKIPRNL